jgi:hypothetical protein
VTNVRSDHVLTLVTAVGTFLAAIAAWRSAFLSKQANLVAANAAQAAADAAQATLYRMVQVTVSTYGLASTVCPLERSIAWKNPFRPEWAISLRTWPATSPSIRMCVPASS